MKKFFMKILFESVLFLFIFFLPLHAGTVNNDIAMAFDLPSLVKSVRFPEPVYFCGSRVPLHEQQVKERLEKEMLLALWDRAQVVLWIKRSTKYFPHIEKILKQQGLPDDLKYISVIESGLRPHAGSSRGAVGFWQFLRSTGRHYGLRVDSKIDQRRNLFNSTKAACSYFQKLYKKFESWPLAAAAYNMGENGLAKAIKGQKLKEYYSLYLPLETQRYFLKAVAAKLIMENNEKYGFKFSKEDFYPESVFDRVNIDSPTEIPLTVIAESANTCFKEIKDMNPEIRGSYLCKGNNSILIPKGCAKGFKKRFSVLLKKWRVKNVKKFHLVKKGENLSIIAKKYNISLASILMWNNLAIRSTIHPGDRVIITSQ
ncbi:MAG: transglycosylase SLT domain-containing protein [Thermodesulfobacteriota bacterium]|nr:transglycosylase SLT domain-containing protein [Thermodesulfobacteriota bacterium]